MGFVEVFIVMVWRIMAKNWYSILVNCKRYDFFHSTRGLKQGDHISHALFILGSNVLSRTINGLHNHKDNDCFYMEMRGPQVNHLSFADDIILLTSRKGRTLKFLMQHFKSCEATSSHLIKYDKSHFMLHYNAFNNSR